MKSDDIYLNHIIESIKKVQKFTKESSKIAFFSNDMMQSATIREIEVIGEAVKNMSYTFKDNNKQIEWSLIAKTRDKMIHHYFGIDLDIVWEIVKKELPKLKKKIENINYK